MEAWPDGRDAATKSTGCDGDAVEAWPDGRDAATKSTVLVVARGGGAVDPALDARLQLALGWDFVDHALLDRALTHRSYCSEHNIEESNERLEFLGDSRARASSSPTSSTHEYPQLPEGELAKLRAAVVSAETLAEIANEIDLGASLRLGQGRGRVGRARQAVDPRRRDGSGDRRGVPRRRTRPGEQARARGARDAASASRRPAPAGRTTRRGSRSSRPSGSTSCPATRCATRAPTTRSGSSPPCCSAASSTAPVRDVRRRRPSRPRRVSRGNGCRARRAAPPPTEGTVSGWGMPELPEVEVVRRDLEREVVGKKIKIGRCRRHARGAPSPQPQAVHHAAGRPQDHQRGAARQVPAAAARRRRRAGDPPRHVGSAAPGEELARDDGEAHPRRHHVHPGRAAALRRPAHVRRDVRHRIRHGREAGHRARAPRHRPARDRDVVGVLRVDAGADATPSSSRC